MHTPSAQQPRLASILLIGLILIGLKVSAQDNADNIEQNTKTEELLKALQEERPPLVEVEPTNIISGGVASTSSLVPYKVRRADWGAYFGLTYSLYEPINYPPDFLGATLGDFESVYGGANSPLIELSGAVKYNFFLGSLAGEIKGGTYSSSGEGADLNLTVVSLGAKLTLDNLLFEPWIAPFASIGVYTVLYDEEQTDGGSGTFNGNTAPAIYYSVGALFQLDWLDQVGALESYIEAGIENTFIIVEARQFLASSEAQDPDFSTDIHVNAGLVVEF